MMAAYWAYLDGPLAPIVGVSPALMGWPNCEVCAEPVDPAAVIGWCRTTHPMCDPGEPDGGVAAVVPLKPRPLVGVGR